ncbi:endonuclease NucS domain-containing protein [Halodesulfovibrio marinisediminis]|uniref:Endonuclease NucS C-terminal domain-containing protein n=1 Tax=Halodesulfovibrio marinisediminis DSM 17456 TaxID=1121457 RepID=A0A1N6FDG8_9BACT|nr:endonuclease NucS domain-containing protein [Halodesulfovibrio marinisediminis]SIN93302.1 Protein of unknown function DUF91 [Halodesulfovibrio marinisediminis DSM 17456]
MSLHKFSNNNTRLSPVEKTTFLDEGVLEVKHIQEALAVDIEILEQRVMVIAREYNKWAGSQKAIDILAIDQDGNLIVIELKRGTNDSTPDLQAIRYAGMVSVMSREDIVSTYQEYAKLETESEAEAVISAFLGGEIEEHSLGEKVRIFIVAQDFTDEVVATVLWLNTQGLDISCYTLSPYKHNDDLLLFSQRLIPLREASEWQGKFARKEREVRASNVKRDYTKFTVVCDGVKRGPLPKNRTILCIVKWLLEKGYASVDELKTLIGRFTNLELFADIVTDDAGTIIQGVDGYRKGRYFEKPEEIIHVGERTVVMSTQWGGEEFFTAMKLLKDKYGSFFECTESVR